MLSSEGWVVDHGMSADPPSERVINTSTPRHRQVSQRLVRDAVERRVLCGAFVAAV